MTRHDVQFVSHPAYRRYRSLLLFSLYFFLLVLSFFVYIYIFYLSFASFYTSVLADMHRKIGSALEKSALARRIKGFDALIQRQRQYQWHQKKKKKELELERLEKTMPSTSWRAAARHCVRCSVYSTVLERERIRYTNFLLSDKLDVRRARYIHTQCLVTSQLANSYCCPSGGFSPLFFSSPILS